MESWNDWIEEQNIAEEDADEGLKRHQGNVEPGKLVERLHEASLREKLVTSDELTVRR